MNYTYQVYTERGTLVSMTLCTEHAWKRRHDLARKRDGDAVARPCRRKSCTDCMTSVKVAAVMTNSVA